MTKTNERGYYTGSRPNTAKILGKDNGLANEITGAKQDRQR